MIAMTAVKIDGASLTSLPLEERKLFGPPLGEPLDGPMETARRQLWRSGDESTGVGLWECAPGRFWTLFDGDGEFLRILEGRLTCIEEGGPTTYLGPRDAMTFPPGWRGEWRIEGTLRKLFAGWHGGGSGASSSPSSRIDGGEVETMPLVEKQPFARFDGGPLGTRGRTSWASEFDGRETGVWECDAGRFGADFGAYGELLQVIGGEVVCLPDDGSGAFTLHAGDAAVFPRGWTGEWDVRAPLRKIYALWEAR